MSAIDSLPCRDEKRSYPILGALIRFITVAAVSALWAVTIRPNAIDMYSRRMLVLNLAATYLAVSGCYVITGRRERKQKLIRVGTFTISLFISLAALEVPVVLGSVDYRHLFMQKGIGLHGPMNRQLDRGLLYHRPPHDRFSEKSVGAATYFIGAGAHRQIYNVDAKYDRHGFRNATDLDTAAVVLIGDSFVEGINVSQNEIASSQLSRILHVDVCNLGQSGYGPPQEFVATRRIALRLVPDVIVWFFFGWNDLADSRRYWSAVNDWEGYVQSTDSLQQRLFHSNVDRWARYLLRNIRWWDTDLARRRSSELGGVSHYFGVEHEPLTSSDLVHFAKTTQILDTLQSHCVKQDSRLLVAYVPTKFEAYQEICEFAKDSECRSWITNGLEKRLGQHCADSRIPFLDLTPILRSAAEQGQLVYLPDDLHWSPSGHAVVAQAIADVIRRESWKIGAVQTQTQDALVRPDRSAERTSSVKQTSSRNSFR